MSRHSLIPIIACSLLLSLVPLASQPAKEPGVAALRRAFADPPPDSRIMMRWWWFGPSVTRNELARELRVMRDGGIGGVEVQPVYPLAPDDTVSGVRNLPFLSDEFTDALRVTATTARELGMRLDLTVGSGWPYGGPQVAIDRAAGKLRVERVTVPAGADSARVPAISPGERLIATFLSRSPDRGDQPRELTDIRDGILHLPADATVVREVTFFIASRTGQMVKRAAVGAEGYVLDHLNRPALDAYLEAVGDRLLQAFGPTPPYAVFCDSLEVYDSDWSSDFLDEFKKRRGYDLKPHLPALVAGDVKVGSADVAPDLKVGPTKMAPDVKVGSADVAPDLKVGPTKTAPDVKVGSADVAPDLKVGPAQKAAVSGSDVGPTFRSGDTEALRDDWGRTLTELLNERFLAPMQEWAHRHGTRFRVQGYGTPPATLSSNAHADLPEGEGAQWKTLSATRWASSASHIYGVPVTSSETWTWLHSPVFRATPLDMKAEADLHFLQGINQLIGHGWPYTPEGMDYPGWRFYAAAVFDEKNPWWTVMPDITRYLQRLSFLLRQGTPVNDVAIYLPDDDAWAHMSPGRVNLFDTLRARLGPNLVARATESGMGFDFFDDEALRTKGKIAAGRLWLGPNQYRAVIVPAVERMPLATLRTLDEFAREGGALIATRRLPALAPGFAATRADHEQVRSTAERLFHGVPTARLVADEDQLPEALRGLVAPDVRFSPESPAIGFVHRHTADAEVYFVANTSNTLQKASAVFRVSGMGAEWWDPMTGVATPAEMRTSAAGTSVELQFEPYASAVLVFSPAVRPRTAAADRSAPAAPRTIDISTEWTLTFDRGKPIALQTLRSWTDDPRTRYYSGVARYERDISLPADVEAGRAKVFLDFGEGRPLEPQRLRSGMQAWLDAPIREAAVVYVNDRRAGSIWCPPYRLDVGSFLRPGANRIRVEVANLAINYMAGRALPDYRLLNLRYGARFDAQDMDKVQPVPAGLLGPVRLVVTGASQSDPPVEWIDESTGHRVIRLSREPGSASLYFHQNAYTAAGDKMVFATRDGLSTVNLKTRDIDQIVQGRVSSVVVGRKTRQVFYFKDGTVYATDLDTKATRAIVTRPELRSGSGLTVNADETLLAGSFVERAIPRTDGGGTDRTTMQLLAAPPPTGQSLEERWAAHLPMALYTISIKDGAVTPFYRSTEWLNHVQFSPSDPSLLMFCHEGPWHKVDRIWTIRTGGTGLRKMHARTMDMEIAGHEFFSPDGKTIWYDLQTPKSQVFWLAGVDIATGVMRKYSVKREEWSVHYNASPDGTLVAGDGGGPRSVAAPGNGQWIYLFTPEGGVLRTERLVDLRNHDYQLEPNVSFTPDGKRIVFRSNMHGASQVYAVEVARRAPGR